MGIELSPRRSIYHAKSSKCASILFIYFNFLFSEKLATLQLLQIQGKIKVMYV